MEALPHEIGDEVRLTEVTCPECCGTLGVMAEGRRRMLHFVCRIGHTYMLEELLAMKEERLDERLWAGVTALEELSALLSGLESSSRYERRRHVVEALVTRLRAIITDNEPVDLSDEGLAATS